MRGSRRRLAENQRRDPLARPSATLSRRGAHGGPGRLWPGLRPPSPPRRREGKTRVGTRLPLPGGATGITRRPRPAGRGEGRGGLMKKNGVQSTSERLDRRPILLRGFCWSPAFGRNLRLTRRLMAELQQKPRSLGVAWSEPRVGNPGNEIATLHPIARGSRLERSNVARSRRRKPVGVEATSHFISAGQALEAGCESRYTFLSEVSRGCILPTWRTSDGKSIPGVSPALA